MSESFQTLRGSSIRLSRRRVCSSGLTSSQYLSRMIPESTIACSTCGDLLEEPLASAPRVQKPMTGSTPARLYQLRSKITTSPAAGKCRDVPLHVHLRLLALGRRRQGDDPEHTGAHPLGDPLDRAALAGGVAPLEDDADLRARRLDPLLHRDELAVQPPHLPLVLLAPQFAGIARGAFRRIVLALPFLAHGMPSVTARLGASARCASTGVGSAAWRRRSHLLVSTTTGRSAARPKHASHSLPVSEVVSRLL